MKWSLIVVAIAVFAWLFLAPLQTQRNDPPSEPQPLPTVEEPQPPPTVEEPPPMEPPANKEVTNEPERSPLDLEIDSKCPQRRTRVSLSPHLLLEFSISLFGPLARHEVPNTSSRSLDAFFLTLLVEIKAADIKRHSVCNGRDLIYDLWLVIDGRVYDVSTFGTCL